MTLREARRAVSILSTLGYSAPTYERDLTTKDRFYYAAATGTPRTGCPGTRKSFSTLDAVQDEAKKILTSWWK